MPKRRRPRRRPEHNPRSGVRNESESSTSGRIPKESKPKGERNGFAPLELDPQQGPRRRTDVDVHGEIAEVCGNLETMRAACGAARTRWTHLPGLARRTQTHISAAGHFFEEAAHRIHSLLGALASQIAQVASETRTSAVMVADELAATNDAIEDLERQAYDAEFETGDLEEGLMAAEKRLAQFTAHRPRQVAPLEQQARAQAELCGALVSSLSCIGKAYRRCGNEKALAIADRAVRELEALGTAEPGWHRASA